jgi:phenylacetate-coenzyme A ligase PaaK-like adenylate-forming protein
MGNASRSRSELLRRVEQLKPPQFERVALDVFQYQAAQNPVYRRYLELLGTPAAEVKTLAQIPFLPISFFKTHDLQTGVWSPEQVFSSSGTSGQTTSRHTLRDEAFYRENAARAFAHFYGSVEEYAVLALLPSYLERSGSSLVFMADDFIRRSAYPQSGFFLYDTDQLRQKLADSLAKGQPTLLLGVSFALLDLAERYPMDLSGAIIMETGGMKGRRREMTRAELHQQLSQAFQVPAIHSEYGMTELLSQAYSKGGGRFQPASTMRVFTREITDPLAPQKPGRTGALNIIDLANLDTISFIGTDDLGRCYPDGSFEVLGRLDASDVRGCNLMVADVQ